MSDDLISLRPGVTSGEHAASVTCGYCKEKVCGCEECQAYCTCEGYQEAVVEPYMKEVERDLGF